MKTLALLLAGALALASLPAAAHPHVTVGFGFGFPYHYYYAPYAYSPWVYPYPAAPYAVPGPVPVAPAEKPPSATWAGSTGRRRKVEASAASMKARSAPKSPWVKFQVHARLAGISTATPRSSASFRTVVQMRPGELPAPWSITSKGTRRVTAASGT